VREVGSFRDPVDEVRERCDLVEIVSQYVALRRSGRTMVGLCPFHNERTPSFHVNPERQRWKCFGCGEGGDVFNFIQKIDNLTFREALEHLARKVGVDIRRAQQGGKVYTEKEIIARVNNIACEFFRSQLRRSSRALGYLERRGLSESTVEKYLIGYAPDSWDGLLNHLIKLRIDPSEAVKAGLLVVREDGKGFYDRFRDRLIFPILDLSDRIIGFGGRALGDDPAKYLNTPETPLFIKSRTLYGLNRARRAIPAENRVIVVEGYMDAITAQEAGFENTVATMGTALTEDHVNIIARFTNNAVLAFDADSAGMAAALRSAPVFERAGLNIRIISMPAGDDPDSLLRKGDRSKFSELVESALPLADYRIKLVLSKYDLQTDEGKTDALKEAAGILAELDSIVERERLIRYLARYHPNFATGTSLAEDHIRAEVARFRSRRARQAQARAVATETQPVVRRLSLIEQSERLLLGIIILRGADPNKVFEALPPKEFSGESARLLAEALSNQFNELGKIDQEDLAIRVAGTAGEQLLTDLLVGLDPEELNHPLDDLISVIINHKKNEKRKRMRTLSKRIAEGLIKRGDEEYEEYYRLVRETSGPWRR